MSLGLPVGTAQERDLHCPMGCVGIVMQGDVQAKVMVAQGAKPIGPICQVISGRDQTLGAIQMDDIARPLIMIARMMTMMMINMVMMMMMKQRSALLPKSNEWRRTPRLISQNPF